MNLSKYLLFNSHSRPPIFPSPPPRSTPFLCFSVLTCLAHLFFFTLHSHTSQCTSIWLYTFFFSLISSLCSAWYVCHNSLTFSGLFPAHFSLWARQPLHVALFPLNMSNPLCPLHLQHCFFPTSSTTISPHAIPCFVVLKCFPLITFLDTALTHLAINADTLTYATAIPFSIVDELDWPSTPLFQFASIVPIIWLISGKSSSHLHCIHLPHHIIIIWTLQQGYSRRIGKTTYWYII